MQNYEQILKQGKKKCCEMVSVCASVMFHNENKIYTTMYTLFDVFYFFTYSVQFFNGRKVSNMTVRACICSILQTKTPPQAFL